MIIHSCKITPVQSRYCMFSMIISFHFSHTCVLMLVSWTSFCNEQGRRRSGGDPDPCCRLAPSSCVKTRRRRPWNAWRRTSETCYMFRMTSSASKSSGPHRYRAWNRVGAASEAAEAATPASAHNTVASWGGEVCVRPTRPTN